MKKETIDTSTGWCYVFYSPTTGLYKIGKSNNPFERMQSIEMQSAIEIKYLIGIGLFNEEDHSQHTEESFLHKQFKSIRVKGEWFSLEFDSLSWIYERWADGLPGDFDFYECEEGAFSHLAEIVSPI